MSPQALAEDLGQLTNYRRGSQLCLAGWAVSSRWPHKPSIWVAKIGQGELLKTKQKKPI